MSTARGENAPTSESIRRHVLELEEEQRAKDQRDMLSAPDMAHAAMNIEERCPAVSVGLGEALPVCQCYLTTGHKGDHRAWSQPVGEFGWKDG